MFKRLHLVFTLICCFLCCQNLKAANDRKLAVMSPNEAKAFFKNFSTYCLSSKFSSYFEVSDISFSHTQDTSLPVKLTYNQSSNPTFVLQTDNTTMSFNRNDENMDYYNKIFTEYELIYSDITWTFLANQNVIYSGNQRILGRPTQVFQINLEAAQFDYIKLAIDQDFMVFLSADYYKNNRLVRQARVNGFKKINNIWAIDSIDIKNILSRKKTRIFMREHNVL